MFRFNLKQFFIIIFVGLIASSCDEETSILAPEGHTDADGLILELSGQEVYREFEGAIITNNLSLSVGDTLELTVHFLDHDGNQIEHSDSEDDHEDHDDHDDGDHGSVDGLLVTENDVNIVIIEAEEHEDGEEEHHENALHLVGVAEGSTTFKIQLMHEGHADYTSMSIVVEVGSVISGGLSSFKTSF